MDHRFVVTTVLTDKQQWEATVRLGDITFTATKHSEWLAVRTAINKCFNALAL